jgi:hypothetical protein
MRARVQRNAREPFYVGNVPWDGRGGKLFAGPIEFSPAEIALLMVIVLTPSLLMGVLGAWLLARRRPKGRRWPSAILGFVGGFFLGLSLQWFGTSFF